MMSEKSAKSIEKQDSVASLNKRIAKASSQAAEAQDTQELPYSWHTQTAEDIIKFSVLVARTQPQEAQRITDFMESYPQVKVPSCYNMHDGGRRSKYTRANIKGIRQYLSHFAIGKARF